MSFGSAIALIQTFATKTSASAFPRLGVSRRDFAHELMERVNSPSRINQSSSSLCGAALVMYALIRRNPATYAKYVIDLYDHGKAKLGDLAVEPGSDCRNYTPGAGIAPVDWVALASLRDSANTLLDYDSVEVEAGGITLPSMMATWFRAAGFKVENRTNLFFDKDLYTLLQANQRHGNGATVCLFIGANLLSGRTGGDIIPDHWVALSSPVRIAGQTTTAMYARGDAVNYDQKLLKSSLSFDVWTWGEPSRGITKNRPSLTVQGFLSYFYGFVAAK